MCRPGHGSSREASAGGHIGPPLRDMGWCSGTNGDWRRTGPPPPGRDGARPLRGTGGVRGGVRLGCGFRQPNFGTKFGASVMGIGPYAPRGDEGRHAGSSCPTGGCGEPPQLPWVAAHSGASAARMGGMGGDRSRDHPKGTINAGQSLSQPVADSSCCGTQNSLLAYAHRILTAATPFCSLLPPLAALANVPLYTREPWGRGMRIAVTSAPNFGT